MGNVLIPIPDRDFDPTEVAVSWRVLTDEGHHVVFATESGRPGVADEIMVTGRGLDLWSALPLVGRITIVGRALRANKAGRGAYTRALERPTDFCDVARGSPGALLKGSGVARDSATDPRPAFVVVDGNYISARWPGDTHTFARTLAAQLEQVR